MAKQKGIIKLDGTIGDITFYKSADGYMAKENAPVSADRIATDPAFARTRENMAEFGRAGNAGKVLRNAIRALLLNAKDGRVTSRLTAQIMQVVKADATSARGQRNVIDGEAELLQGFEFNVNARLDATLYTPYTASINRVTGILAADTPSFIPANSIVAPDGTTHFSIVSLGTEIDFEAESFVSADANTGMLPWNNVATAVISMQNAVTPNSTHPLFLLMGIQFYQQVNGTSYPLKNGGFNALKLVKVEGV